MDYYTSLGISKTASADEIKKAYRKLAMKHHPDRNGGDDTKFKEINEAYDTLSDPEKRAAYDSPRPQFHGGSFKDHFGSNYEDIFAQMFGNQFQYQPHRQNARTRNPDIKIRLKLTLEEVFTGKQVIASYRLKNGREESVNLDIPPGVKDGDNIKFTGLGDNSITGPRGDLYVIIQVLNAPGWTRDSDDIKTKIKVNSLKLIVGTKTVVNTIEGKQLELTIPAGTKNGTTFSVNGYGIPNVKSGTRGRLFITVEAETPSLSENSIEKIREILNENT